jgi:tetratricopeptide (TPR) repeat protein
VSRYSTAVALAVGLIAASPCRAAQKWTILQSGALIVIGDQSPSTLGDVAREIEQFRAVVGGLIHNADRPLPVPTVVFVVGDRKSLEPLLPLYKGRPATIAGYASEGQDANYIVMSREGYEESAAVTFHEYTHLLIANAVRALPVWVDEGLAEYYSTYALVDRGKAAEVGRAVKPHVLLLRQHYLPLAELIAVDKSSPMYNEGERQSIFCAESWALAHYLMIEKPNGGQAINKYVTEVAEGRSASDAFQDAFGSSPSDFDKELQKYVRRPSFKAVHFTFPEKLTVVEVPADRAMTAGEVDAWLGDVQRRVSRMEEAGPRIERAAAAEPTVAITQLVLGLLRLSQDRIADALEAFDRASALAPGDFLTQYISGVSQLRADPQGSEEHRARALAALKRAVMLNGTSAGAHAALAYVQMFSQSTLTDAQTSIEHAIALAPGRLDFRLRDADIRLLRGDVDAARAMLTSISAIKSDSVAAQAAATRLKAIAANEASISARAEAGGRAPTTADERAPTTTDERAPTTTDKRAPTTADGRPSTTTDGRSGVMLRRVRAGESRALGTLTRVDCSLDSVRFTVQSAGRTLVAAATSMADIELTEFVGDPNFTLACGSHASPELVYLTWRPNDEWGLAAVGTAVAVEFLPKTFVP